MVSGVLRFCNLNKLPFKGKSLINIIMETLNEVLVKCNRCQKYKKLECYMKKNTQFKYCIDCRIYRVEITKKNQKHCECGKNILNCKIHGNTKKIVLSGIYKGVKKYNVSYEFLENLLNNKCYHCKCEMTLNKYNENELTRVRLSKINISAKHSTDNTILCCYNCLQKHRLNNLRG